MTTFDCTCGMGSECQCNATRSRAADCPRCGKPNEGRHPITDDKPDICGLVIGGRVCMLPASGNATPDRVAIAERLRERARMYQADDGSPGPMGDVWGWRSIAKWLHFEADRLEADGA